MKKILVVDGNSILNRAFYGIRLLTNKDGLPTNAVYGMVTILSKHLETLAPDYCAVAFDLKEPTFRHKMYEGYKATRHGMPDELAAQLPYAKECVRNMGFCVLETPGFEADDILGTLAARAEGEGVRAYILTGDRDSLQLISDTTHVLLATNKDTIEFGRDEFNEKYGISPEQFVDVKALMGDSSDNIPGVAGIGEKTAFKLISEFGSLDGVYENYSDSTLTPSVKAKLEAGKDSAYMSKTLATIVKDAPVPNDFDALKNEGFKSRELRELFEKLEFSALIKRFSLDAPNAEISEEREDKPAINIVEKTFDEVLTLTSGKSVSLYINENECEMCDGQSVYKFSVPKLFELEKLFSSARVVVNDAKQLYKDFDANGKRIRGAYFDIMLGAYVCDANRNRFGLGELYLSYLGKTYTEEIPVSLAIYEIYTEEISEIEKNGFSKLMFEIEMPLAAVLADMEEVGFRLDTEGIAKYGIALNDIAEALTERIYYAAGSEFNINSPKQLGEVLFEKLMLPKSKKTKTGYSTDAETLAKLVPYHPIIEDILDYRQVTKLKSTYADGLLKLVDENGRVHTSFNQTGTATGRLSSSEPNLQNIPVKTELGREFRKFFIPENDDYCLIDADYSQIELRLLAHISDDEGMIEAFKSGADIHTSTACKVFGVEPENVTVELRKRAKAVNFGIVYGIGEFSLSEDLGISRAEAKRYIESYLAGFPKVSEYLDNVKQQAKADGFVTTLFSRRRYIPELSSSNKNLQHFGERVAMNSPIQGTAADVIKLAMINVDKRLKESGLDARLILQVHDELLIESSKSCADEALKILVEEMENTSSFRVPLSVEAHIGDTWFGAK